MRQIRTIEEADVIWHTMIIGGTGSGKTNCMLYWLKRLHERGDVALILLDPAGDPSIELMRSLEDWTRVTLLDPVSVTFGLNPLALPEGITPQERVNVMQTQVEELSLLLSDVFNTETANAPRLMWILKGALYYLYTFTDAPTFYALYSLLTDFMSLSKDEVREMLEGRGLQEEVIQMTIEAISQLEKSAFSAVINRISNFVLPPHSITSRTFCCDSSKVDFKRMMEPGQLTIFRLGGVTGLPEEFRELFSSSVVLKLYFSVLRRAKELEMENKGAESRPAIVLAIDEFQNVSGMKIMDRILTEARKFGLFLWMAFQNTGLIRKDLFNTMIGNVGPIFAFKMGPDDARFVAEVLDPVHKEEIYHNLIRWPSWKCYARKNPMKGRTVDPIRLEPHPKLKDPVHSLRDVLEFMLIEMEQRYGGAVESSDAIYKVAVERMKAERGEAPVKPVHWTVLTKAYLSLLSGTPEFEFQRLRDEFHSKFEWPPSVTHKALNELVDAGYLTVSFEYRQYIQKGKDTYGNPIMVPVDMSVVDEKERARITVYRLTPLALELFQMKFGPNRAGGPEHMRVVEKLLKERYWPLGYWCVVDWGDKPGVERPDIAVVKPQTIKVKDKKTGNEIEVPSPYIWDYKNSEALEIEIYPSKSQSQVKKNYSKNSAYSKVIFVVTMPEHKKWFEEAMGSDLEVDNTRWRVELMPFDELNLTKPSARATVALSAARHDLQSEPTLPRAGESPISIPGKDKEQVTEQPTRQAVTERGRQVEVLLLYFIAKSGYVSRDDLVKKCASVGLKTSERSISRQLKDLADRGLLVFTAQGYEPTPEAIRVVKTVPHP